MTDHTERIAKLKDALPDISPDVTMQQAAHRALLRDFIQMLEHEAGSRTGEDIEDVHDMRVATRRMRSIFQLLSGYFKPKTIAPYQESLKHIARALGSVRDFDVMIDNLTQFKATLDADEQEALQLSIDDLEAQRHVARANLLKTLDKKRYRHFLKDFEAYLIKPINDADNAHSVEPSQARHLLPIEIYKHLAAIRAYTVEIVETADVETLHALRIECKKLRYLFSIFSDLLGAPGKEFLQELKTIQDHLGDLNDAVIAQAALAGQLEELDGAPAEALQRYIDAQAARETELYATFPAVWRHFNTKTVQRQLANALASL